MYQCGRTIGYQCKMPPRGSNIPLWAGSKPDPPENCHLTVKKLPMAILLKKMTIFVNFFEKNVKFWAIFWQFFDSKMAIFRRVSFPVNSLRSDLHLFAWVDGESVEFSVKFSPHEVQASVVSKCAPFSVDDDLFIQETLRLLITLTCVVLVKHLKNK